MRGMNIFQKPYYREISTMRGRPMRGLPVLRNGVNSDNKIGNFRSLECIVAKPMTLSELGKLADLNFDGFEN